MDLNAIWQQHKIFILAALGGFILFLLGESYIGGLSGEARTLNNRVNRSLKDLKKIVQVKRTDLSSVRKENESLKKDLESLAKRLQFQPRDAFKLSPDDREPDLTYNRIYREAVQAVVEGGAAAGVDIDPSLGLPDTTPSGREEIEEHLKYLDLIVRIAELAIQNDLKSISKIKILREKRSARVIPFYTESAVELEVIAHSESLGFFLEDLQRPEQYLPLGRSSIAFSEKEPDMVEATVRILGLEVDLERPFEVEIKGRRKR